MKLSREQIGNYRKLGYIKAKVLTNNESKKLTKICEENFINLQASKNLNRFDFLQFKFLNNTLFSIVHNKIVCQIVQQLLGDKDIILDNAILFSGTEGTVYKQGWHRDILQLSDNLISDKLFSPNHFHNNVQINIALQPDPCFFVIPGSHIRPYNQNEKNIFNGENITSMNATLPNTINLTLEPGEAILYNNHLIHRGFSPSLKNHRLTFQIGYHAGKFPPTCHFFALNIDNLTPRMLDKCTPRVKDILNRHLVKRRNCKDINKTFTKHQKILTSMFKF